MEETSRSQGRKFILLLRLSVRTPVKIRKAVISFCQDTMPFTAFDLMAPKKKLSYQRGRGICQIRIVNESFE